MIRKTIDIRQEEIKNETLLLDMNEMESEEAVHNYLMENWRFPTIMEKSGCPV